jgi:transposase InsO family protein
MRDPWEIATWRFEQISPLLDASLSRSEKRQYIREKSARPSRWPRSKSGRAPRRPIGRATLHRWLRLYEKEGLRGLLPKAPVRDKTDRSDLLAYVLALLVEEPGRSLTQLLLYLELEFPDHKISRSTLHRELAGHPAYAGIVKRRKTRTLRDRYETTAPHECWQLDGKGPFRVQLAGAAQRLHVLSVIDDFSRFILAAVIAPGESIAAVVRVTRRALQKYGLPGRMQFDRGSAFDSLDFRRGLAILGIHRNWAKPRHPEFQGKIEAYHRVLNRWFIRELRHQEVTSIAHLEELLGATIGLLYNRHRHREIRMPPEQALAGRVSARRVGSEDLQRAFWGRLVARSHPKTGEVRLPNGAFRVPSRYAGHRAIFRFDHADPERAVLVTARHEEIELGTFATKRAFAGDSAAAPSGAGQLQKLLDRWRGRPNAAPQFGLPEVFRLLGCLLGHLPPRDEREARTIHEFYRQFGPLHPEHLRAAVDTTRNDLGEGRPLESYLAHLARLIRAHRPPEERS